MTVYILCTTILSFFTTSHKLEEIMSRFLQVLSGLFFLLGGVFTVVFVSQALWQYDGHYKTFMDFYLGLWVAAGVIEIGAGVFLLRRKSPENGRGLFYTHLCA